MGHLMREVIVNAADELLGSMGLMRKRSIGSLGPAAMWFSAGAICGGCIALVLTPMSGAELVDEVERRLQRARDRIRSEMRPTDKKKGENKNDRSRASQHGEVSEA